MTAFTNKFFLWTKERPRGFFEKKKTLFFPYKHMFFLSTLSALHQAQRIATTVENTRVVLSAL
jgi:hypothetical protein